METENDWADALGDEESSPPEEEIVLTEEQKLILIAQGMLLQQFLESEKFRTFVSMNYDLMRDEETKLLYVVEVPDDVAAQRALAVMKTHAAEGPRVITPSVAEAQKVLNDPEFLKKAKGAQKG